MFNLILKIGYQAIFFILILCVLFGFVLPTLISWDETYIVIGGFLLLIISIFPIALYGKIIYKNIRLIGEKRNESKNDFINCDNN